MSIYSLFQLSKLPTADVWNVLSLCANKRLQMLSPLSDGSVANALLQTTQDVNQSLLEFIDIVDLCLIDMLLYNSPNLVVNEV